MDNRLLIIIILGLIFLIVIIDIFLLLQRYDLKRRKLVENRQLITEKIFKTFDEAERFLLYECKSRIIKNLISRTNYKIYLAENSFVLIEHYRSNKFIVSNDFYYILNFIFITAFR